MMAEGEQVAQRRLRALDLQGDYRLLANEAVEEPVRARDHRSGNRQATERSPGFCQQTLLVVQGERRPRRREGGRNE